MVNLPSTELLESHHSFPCAWTFKVIGYADANFTARVVWSVREELGMEVDPPYSLRSTAQGRHVAVTLGSSLSVFAAGAGRLYATFRAGWPRDAALMNRRVLAGIDL